VTIDINIGALRPFLPDDVIQGRVMAASVLVRLWLVKNHPLNGKGVISDRISAEFALGGNQPQVRNLDRLLF